MKQIILLIFFCLSALLLILNPSSTLQLALLLSSLPFTLIYVTGEGFAVLLSFTKLN